MWGSGPLETPIKLPCGIPFINIGTPIGTNASVLRVLTQFSPHRLPPIPPPSPPPPPGAVPERLRSPLRQPRVPAPPLRHYLPAADPADGAGFRGPRGAFVPHVTLHWAGRRADTQVRATAFIQPMRPPMHPASSPPTCRLVPPMHLTMRSCLPTPPCPHVHAGPCGPPMHRPCDLIPLPAHAQVRAGTCGPAPR